MKIANIVRYSLWGGIVATAEANRRRYGMSTTWLPHLLTNTLTLLLPDLHRLASHGLDGRVAVPSAPKLVAEAGLLARDTLASLVRDNPRYVAYVTPLAAGYLLSHPDFNIYKGEMGEMNLGGFGLDAIPHTATAFALTALICDTITEAHAQSPGDGALTPALAWCDDHAVALSGGLLALATAWWEVGEYLIHRHEIGLRGSAESINMQWSPRDTLFDCLSNAIGWALASALRTRRHAA